MRISDWSSDVCASDLARLNLLDNAISESKLLAIERGDSFLAPQESPLHVLGVITRAHFLVMRQLRTGQELDCLGGARNCPAVAEDLGIIHSRSEERRVGKECVRRCRSRWWPSN